MTGPTPMRAAYGWSLAAHAAVVVAIHAGAFLHARNVEGSASAGGAAPQAKPEPAAQAPAAPHEARSEERSVVAENLRLEVAGVIAAATPSEIPPALLERVGRTLDDLFASDAGGEAGAGGEPDPEAARLAALDAAVAGVDDELRLALVDQVRRHVREVVAPELNARIDRELKHRVGDTLHDGIRKGLDETHGKRLRELAQGLRAAAGGLDPAHGHAERARQAAERGDAAAAAAAAAEARAAAATAATAAEASLTALASEDPAAGERIAALREDRAAAALAGDAATTRAAADAVRERQRGLRELADEVDRHARDPKADAVERALVAGARDVLAPELRAAVAKEVAERAIPAAVDQIAAAVDRDLERLGLDKAAFSEHLRADIVTALGESVGGDAAAGDVAPAWLRTDAALGTSDGSALASAGNALSEASRALAELAARQGTITPGAPSAAPDQAALAAAIAAANADARRAVAAAGAATIGAEGELDAARRELAATLDPARAASAALARGDQGEAGQRIGQSQQALTAAANRLGALGATVSSAAAAAKPTDAATSVGDPAAVALVAASGRGAVEKVSGALGQVANGLPVNGTLGDGARLAQLRELRASLANAAKNARDGRPGASGLAAQLGRGAGRGAARTAMTRINEQAYAAFVKDLHARTTPGNAFAAVAVPTGLDTVASAAAARQPALVWAARAAADAAAATPAAPRQVPAPSFTHVAFASAPMQSGPLTIDGDLGDWGELTQPVRMRWRHDDQQPIEGGPAIHLRWSNQGLYIGYAVQDPGGIQPNTDAPWLGDCLEVWLDCDNQRRSSMRQSPGSHQLCFTPFGLGGDPARTFTEIGRGLRGLNNNQAFSDARRERGWSAAKVIPGGYSVECFVRREALAKPVLVPGAYLAMNFSLSTDYEFANQMQWSASKVLGTWDRPDTWGDVLLLGADGEIALGDAAGEALAQVVPGQVVSVTVRDADMDLDPTQVDRVSAMVASGDADEGLFVVLAETGPATGVFRATLNTQLYLEEPRRNTLNLRPGAAITATYQDPRAAFGETARSVSATAPVAAPIIAITAATVSGASP